MNGFSLLDISQEAIKISPKYQTTHRLSLNRLQPTPRLKGAMVPPWDAFKSPKIFIGAGAGGSLAVPLIKSETRLQLQATWILPNAPVSFTLFNPIESLFSSVAQNPEEFSKFWETDRPQELETLEAGRKKAACV